MTRNRLVNRYLFDTFKLSAFEVIEKDDTMDHLFKDGIKLVDKNNGVIQIGESYDDGIICVVYEGTMEKYRYLVISEVWQRVSKERI